MTRNAELKTKLMHTTEPCFTLAQLATLRLKILKTQKGKKEMRATLLVRLLSGSLVSLVYMIMF